MSPTTDKPKIPKRRWLRFGIRSLMLLVLVISLPMGLIGRDLYRYRIEQAIVLELQTAGCEVHTSRFGVMPFTQDDVVEIPEFSWRQRILVNIFGEGFYRRPYFVQVKQCDVAPLLQPLAKLETLQFLTFDQSDFTNASGEPISKMKRLTYLHLEEANIEARLLQQFAHLPYLIELSLSQMKLSDAHLEALTVSKSIEDLRLFDVSISKRGFHHLSQIRCVKRLNITVPNEITEQGLCLLASHQTLEELILIHAPIDDQCLHAFSQISTLRELDITGSPDDVHISCEGLEHLAGLSQLEVLEFPFLPLTDDELRSIGRLKNLKEFWCLGTEISDRGLSYLLQLEHLESLCIQEAQPSMEAMRSLARSRSIRTVDLGNGLECSFPENASGNYGMPYADSRADYDQNRRGKVTRSVFCLVGEIPLPFPNIPSVEDPSTTPTELPNNFADTINDPFLPPSEELAIE